MADEPPRLTDGLRVIEHAQLLATQWQWIYNNIRPHLAIGGVPPRQLL
jgi:putative transposase